MVGNISIIIFAVDCNIAHALWLATANYHQCILVHLCVCSEHSYDQNKKQYNVGLMLCVFHIPQYEPIHVVDMAPPASDP